MQELVLKCAECVISLLNSKNGLAGVLPHRTISSPSVCAATWERAFPNAVFIFNKVDAQVLGACNKLSCVL